MSNRHLYAPSLYLYAFELADKSPKPKDRIIYQQSEKLLKKFKSPTETRSKIPKTSPANSTNPLRFSYDMTPQNSDRRFSHKIKGSENEYPIWGYAHAKPINDSDSLWFNLHVPDRESGSGKLIEFPIEMLQAFNQNNQLILNSDDPENENFLGQTLILTARLTDRQKLQVKTQHNYLRNLSDDCINSLFADRQIKPPFNRSGQLFGSPIFEYGFGDFSLDRHVLIWFLQDKTTQQTYDRCQEELFNLFFDRHKILATYRQIQPIYELITEQSQNIKKEIDRFQTAAKTDSLPGQTLKPLETQLRTLPKLALNYAEVLRNLEASRHAIAMNSHDYHEKVTQIELLCPNDAESIAFLSHFSQMNTPVFEKKIQGYLNDVKFGEKLIEQAISAIRGLIELEQVQRDRRLENKLQALAAGLGTAGIFAESSDYIIVPAKPLTIPVINLPVQPFVSTVTLSILVGVFTFIAMERFLNNRSSAKK